MDLVSLQAEPSSIWCTLHSNSETREWKENSSRLVFGWRLLWLLVSLTALIVLYLLIFAALVFQDECQIESVCLNWEKEVRSIFTSDAKHIKGSVK